VGGRAHGGRDTEPPSPVAMPRRNIAAKGDELEFLFFNMIFMVILD